MYAFRKDEPSYDILGAPGGLGRVGPQRTPEGYRRTGMEYRGPPEGRAAIGQTYNTSIAYVVQECLRVALYKLPSLAG